MLGLHIREEEFSDRLLVDSQKYQLDIIDDIVDNSLDTFIKSIECAHKFYNDVVRSYYKYIMTINDSSKY